ncbi:MAG: histidine kinase, partial [Bacteroidota bacterium]|nr:histidine kinase [Bacteroidota bacterium]
VSFAQTPTIDSLKKILPSLKGTARIDCLNELGAEFSDRYWSKSRYQQTDTALMYTLRAQQESQQFHYQEGIGKALLNLGIIEEEHGNFKLAEEYTRKAMPVLQKENMQADYHRCWDFLGWILNNRGFFAQCIQIYKQELPYYEAIKDSEHIASICRVTARAYDFQGNSGNAFTYFQKDFAIQKKPADAWGKRSTATLKASVYLAAGDTAIAAFYYKQAAIVSVDKRVILGGYHSNMAMAYSLQKKFDSALLEIHEKIAEIQSSNTDSLFRKVALMISYKELSDLFLSQKKYDSSIICALQCKGFFENGDYVVFLLPVLKTIATAYNAKNQNSKALDYTNQLLAYAQRSGARPFERDGYKLLWKIYTDQQKTNLANDYHLKYMLLNDSLQNDKYISQAAAWQAINDINMNEATYQNKLKINEERNKAKIESIANEKKIQLYVFIAAIGLIGLFIILIVRNNTLKRKKDKLQLMMTEANMLLEKQKREQEVAQLHQQKTELEMQALRAQMNPHFIFNCLSSVNRFILINRTEEASDYLTKFSRLIRMALHNSEKSFITLENELEALRLYLDLEKLRFKNAFDFSISLVNTIDVSAVFIPPMLLQPFIENAIWHGLMHKRDGGFLDIALSIEEKILTCIITDNGIGRNNAAMINSKSAEKNKSMGVKITTERLALLSRNEDERAVFDIEDLTDKEGNAAGTKVILKMKYRKLADVFEHQKQ